MGRVSRWIDERIDLKALRATLLDRKVPGGLSLWHTLGSATLAVFTVQVVTGVILAMYYAPSPDHAYDSIRFLERNVMSGALLRGMHHWGASAMVLLVLAHMIRVFSMGAYKYPREINWLLGVVLLFIVLGFSFTGYLLPWDQKAYWATQVGTNIAGTTPLVGGVLVRLLRGGSQLGAATLTRFYSLHVLLFPLLLGGIVLVHLALVIRQGIAPRPHALEQNAPERTSDAAYPGYYEEHYAKAKAADVRFWPDIVAKDIAVATAVILIIFLLARFAGAGLDAPADPTDAAYIPRPEWYFLPFFQLLKLVPGSMESAVAVGVPAAIVLVLLLLPFFDRRSKRSLFHRPIAGVLLAGTLISLDVDDKLARATQLFKEHGISQMPVLDQGKLAGILTEADLLHHLVAGHVNADTVVAEVMERKVATVGMHASSSELPRIFERGEVALVCDDERHVLSLISKMDLIELLASRKAARPHS